MSPLIPSPPLYNQYWSNQCSHWAVNAQLSECLTNFNFTCRHNINLYLPHWKLETWVLSITVCHTTRRSSIYFYEVNLSEMYFFPVFDINVTCRGHPICPALTMKLGWYFYLDINRQLVRHLEQMVSEAVRPPVCGLCRLGEKSGEDRRGADVVITLYFSYQAH